MSSRGLQGNRSSRATRLILSGWAALALVSCGGPPSPNLLVISVDTLRPDHLGYEGYGRDTSPVFDRLAREGVIFENALSPAGWTLPSLATIFTGLHPRDHGATLYDRGVRPGLPNLTTLLDERGYDTRAFVSHILLGAPYGFARGFDLFDDSVLRVGNPHDIATARPLTDRVLENLQADPLEPPFFLWVHYFDPHFKYLRHPESAAFGGQRRDRYDGEITHTDRQVGRLLDRLRSAGLYAGSVVVFLSDHGEEFQEHGGRHHDTLYEEILRVPLVIRAPGLEPGRRELAAQQIDLLPTLAGLLHFELPRAGSGGAGALPGVDLLADMSKAEVAARPLFAERDLPLPFRQRSVRLGDQKLIVIDLVPVGVDENRVAPAKTKYKPRLEPGIAQYDLAADPGETVNVYREDSPTSKQLMELLLAHFDEGIGPANRVPVDDQMIRKLRALGYLQ